MKLLFIIVSLFFIADGYSQINKNLHISLMSFYESWDVINNRDVSELSNIFSISYNFEQQTSIMLNSKYASIGGDVNDLGGFSDIQIVARHYLSGDNLSFTGGLNIPSGKTKLNSEEFITSQFISQDLFNLRTPGFGQGFNFFLGAAWLTRLSDNFVAGTGLSYQVKGEYQPLEENTFRYNPSNEISATAGFDLKLDQTSTLTGDITGIFYGKDKIDDEEVFSSGTRIIADLLYKKYYGFDYLTVLALYRNIGSDELAGIYAVLNNEKINPDQFHLSLAYSQRMSSVMRFEYILFTSIFEKTASVFSGYKILGLGINPEFIISPAFRIPVFLKYSVGIAGSESDIRNFEAGAGLSFSF